MGLFDYWNDSNLPKAKENFNNELDSLLNKARNVPDAWERIKFVHDEIVDMTTYDKESYELGEAAGAMKDAYSNSAYGPLVEGFALCGGYAKLFELVMHRLGYECEYITGTADGGPHAWNLLVLDGERYYVDLTWDDPDLDDGMRLYNYFCVNDAMIEKTHTVDPELKNIKVSATEYNYHVHESLYLTEYNFTSVENIVTSNKSENVISIRFADNKAKREAFEDLVDNYKFYDILQKINKDDYSYIDNDDLNILTFIIG
jgi:transglutaminase/protease-like cytokinesis protein 3